MAEEAEEIEEHFFGGIGTKEIGGVKAMKRRDENWRMKTKSLCPVCFRVIDAELYEEDNKILMKKRCEKHGEFDDVYWGDAEMYHKFARWKCDGKPGIVITGTDKGCPFDCGLCPEHKSSTMLALIDLTNRCNQRCPTCFANAAVTGYLYEPTMEQIVKMMELLREETPPCPAIQFSGGEPTIRENFVDIVKLREDSDFRIFKWRQMG